MRKNSFKLPKVKTPKFKAPKVTRIKFVMPKITKNGQFRSGYLRGLPKFK